jgi:hypothetical protein
VARGAAGARRRPRDPAKSFLLLFVVAMGVALYCAFLPTERGRWNYPMHDRGVHALAAIKVATSIHAGDWGTFFGEIWKPKLYPPLQAWLGAIAALVAGPHYRVVLVPSLVGWMGMLLVGTGLAHRLAGRWGKLAAVAGGAATLLLMLASPADRFYATDTMLESLGAGLTVAVLYAYARVRETWAQEPAKWVRWLGLALTLLFFEKYNYWLLVMIGLAVDLAADAPVRAWIGERLRGRGGALLRHLARQPLLWIAFALLLAAYIIGKRGVPTFIGGINLYPPRGLLMVMMWALAGQLALEVARRGRAGWLALPPWVRTLWGWHGLPLLVWLMLPGRLGTILSFVGTGNAGDARYPGWSGVVYYAQCLATQYTLGWAMLALTAVLALAGAAVAIKKGGGARGVLMVLLVGGRLALLHPNKQGRYLHSWIPALWILAGVGAAGIVAAAERRRAWAGWTLAAAGCGALAFWTARGVAREPVGHDELAQYGRKGSLLDVTDKYLREVGGFRRVAIIAPTGWPVVEWTFLEKMGDPRKLDLVRWESGTTAAQAADLVRAWAAGPGRRCDAVVVITPLAEDPHGPRSLWTDEGYGDAGVTPAALAALKAGGYLTVEIMRLSASSAEIDLLVPPAGAPGSAAASMPAASAPGAATTP